MNEVSKYILTCTLWPSKFSHLENRDNAYLAGLFRGLNENICVQST